MSPAEQIDFFVSYTSADRPWAEWIAWVLEDEGYNVRIQAWDFRAGANFVLEMDEAARVSRRTLAVLSPAFLESRYAAVEWAAAFREDPEGKRRKLLPVRVRECDINGLLGSVVYVDLVGLAEDVARERVLSEAGGGRAKPEAAPVFPGDRIRDREAPALPAGGAAIWNVPAVRGRFVGREALLDDLAERLSAGEATPLTHVQALHGLGGVGKTRVAIEFARRHRDDYDVVWWVRSEDPVTILADYAAFADAVALPQHGEGEQEARVAAVRAWFEGNGRWLLVFDNAPGPEVLYNVIPDSVSGHVFITSRRQGGWRGIAHPYPVNTWSRKESVPFLEMRTDDRDWDAADAIAEALGDLPLALEQAAAYVDSTQISLAGYERRLQSHAPALFEHGRPPDYEHTVATTWQLAFAELEEDSECATVLFCCAFLAPEQIPRELFAREAIADGVFATADGDLALDDAIKRMMAFSLVTGNERYLSMHRVVQHVIRNRLGVQREHWITVSEQLVAEAFPAEGHDHRTWPACERVLPHAIAVTDHARQAGVETGQTATLLASIVRYLFGRAEFGAAKALCERALKIFEAAYGPEHPEIARTLVNLANVHLQLGDLEGARDRQQRALQIFQVAYGPEHPEIAKTLGNLGVVLAHLSDLEGARDHLQRALQIFEVAYGPEHPDVATALVNLGNVDLQLGDLEGARDRLQRALQIRETAYGPEHPEVASTLGNLGIVLQELGNLEGARDRLQRALQIFEVAYGPEHPDVATALVNLGNVYLQLGDLEGARDCLQRALQIRETAYGPEHPATAAALGNLGNVQLQLGDLESARDCLQRALQIFEATYGPDHPDAARTLESLSNML